MNTLTRKQIKDLRKELIVLDSKYHINSGGCCFVASCLAREFENKNMPFKVIFQSNYRNSTLPSHVLIRLPKTRLVNIINSKNYYLNKTKTMTSKDLDKFYHSVKSWNNRYDPRYNSTVSRKIEAFFKGIEVVN